MSEVQEQAKEQTQEQKLPPLSPADFRIYNSKAEHMDYFHSNFRRSWNILWEATESGRRPKNMTLKQFLSVGLHFAEHLEVHHHIEETYIFPVLAKKMPEFQAGKGKGKRAAELLRQHREIHAGLDGFKEYLEKCSSGEEELRLETLREKMVNWKDVLWSHLDQEVRTLGAENMRRYWTKEEMATIPM
ncbi:hemerythrin domain-containing protein [Aspergillus undulatus]|uniref:hemerythrin domain-containing protein n=1 Tax=Aspergillus undulatus TaxID=1810928 RepID=UPI003CCC91B8